MGPWISCGKKLMKAESGRSFLCRVPTTVAVNQITDGLKRVKADAKRHDQPSEDGAVAENAPESSSAK